MWVVGHSRGVEKNPWALCMLTVNDNIVLILCTPAWEKYPQYTSAAHKIIDKAATLWVNFHKSQVFGKRSDYKVWKKRQDCMKSWFLWLDVCLDKLSSKQIKQNKQKNPCCFINLFNPSSPLCVCSNFKWLFCQHAKVPEWQLKTIATDLLPHPYKCFSVNTESPWVELFRLEGQWQTNKKPPDKIWYCSTVVL